MLRFLRQIRRRLLSENRFSRYLLYATGEIVLVVIGILIALQINNWNEQRKENNLEQNYYCKLLEDVEQDLAQVHEQILKTEDRLSAANEMLRLLQSEHPSVEAVMQNSLKAISLITYTFRPNIAAYEDLKSSGNLKILRDHEVKKRVTEYYTWLDGMIDVMDTNADGTVALFYAKPDYAQIGWQYLDFVKAGIDSSKVNFNQLLPKTFDLDGFTNTMTSDAIYFVGSNARIKYLYEAVLPDMESMQQLLKPKCKSK